MLPTFQMWAGCKLLTKYVAMRAGMGTIKAALGCTAVNLLGRHWIWEQSLDACACPIDLAWIMYCLGFHHGRKELQVM
jgi:hypothetical protein